jgi:large subunit ribosomal protein L24
MKRIKQGDNVIILTGKSKGGVGKVSLVKDDKVIVPGQNLAKKHVKPNPNIQEPGGIKEIAMPIHVSNVALVNPQTNKADKVGFKFIELEDGTKVKKRYFKSDGQLVESE